MKVIVAGSRTFNNYYKLRDKLNSILRNQKDVTIISGTASGADRLGEISAELRPELCRYPRGEICN